MPCPIEAALGMDRGPSELYFKFESLTYLFSMFCDHGAEVHKMLAKLPKYVAEIAQTKVVK